MSSRPPLLPASSPTPVVGRVSATVPPAAPGLLGPGSLREALTTIRAHWRLVLLIMLLPTAAGAYLAYSFRPEYRATAVVRMADARRSVAAGLTNISDAISASTIDPVLSGVQDLMSRGVAGQAVDSIVALRVWTRQMPADALGNVALVGEASTDTILLRFGPGGFTAAAHPGTRQRGTYGVPVEAAGIRFVIPARPPVEEGEILLRSREAAIDHVLRRLSVKPRPQTDVIDVSYTDPDPALAQRIVNMLITVFQRASATGAQTESRLRRIFLEQQLQKNNALLDQAQRALSAFRSGAQFYSSKDRLSADQADMTSLEAKRNELNTDRKTYADLLAQLEGGDTSATALTAIGASPTVASNPVIGQLYTQFLRYKAARDSLTAGPWGRAESHPDVARLNTLLRGTKAQLVAAVKNMLASMDTRIQALDTLRSRSRATFQQVSGKEVEESQLVQQVEALRNISDQLRLEFQKAQIAEAVEAGQVKVIDPATRPTHGVGVGPVRRVAFGLMLGIVLGVLAAFAAEHLNSSIRRQMQLESALQVPGLAVIPPQPGRLRRRSQHQLPAGEPIIAASESLSMAAEAYRQLRTNLLFSRPDHPPKTILVTSPRPGDGKTTVATNLVVTFAQQGMRALLVDCDLRRGRLHHIFGLSRQPGLTDVLAGKLDPMSAIRMTEVPGLEVLTSGAVVPTPAEFLGSSVMHELLARLTEVYAVVVLDSTPVLAATDAVILSAKVQAALLVIRAGRTDEEEAQRALRQLLAVGAHVVGAVLNDQDSRLQNYESYGYQAYYAQST